MNIKVSLKNVMIACIFFAGLAISSTSFGQFTVPPNGHNYLIRNMDREIRWLANNDGSNHNEGFGFYVGKNPGRLALRIGHSGNVGIGVYNPEFPLVVNGAAKANSFITNWVTKNVRDGYLTLGGYPGAPYSIGMYILGTGRVGVGTRTPEAKFQIAGDLKATTGKFNHLNVNNDVSVTGNISGKVLTAQGGTFQGLTASYLNVNNDLSVTGNISAKRISLAVGSFPDYVFAKDYDLMPLEQVEAYIKANHHLPKVPAATQVIKEGMDVAQINVLLMEKVEELTLHLIAQNKQIKKLMQEVKTLKAQK